MRNGYVTLFPFWYDLQNYTTSFFRRDIFSAFSVALMALPQSMAYAFVAELPTSAGIFSAIFGTIFTASFGASKFLISGPSNVVAILIQSGTAEILSTFYKNAVGPEKEALALGIVLQLTFLIGIFQILGGLLRLGRVTQFASRPVVVGYIAGAAVTIFVTQAFYFFGIGEMEEAASTYKQGWFLLSHLGSLHLPSTFLAIGSLLLLIYLYWKFPRIPYAVIVLACAAIVVFALQQGRLKTPYYEIPAGARVSQVLLLEEVAPLTRELPHVRLPPFDWHLFTKLIPFAFAITLLSVFEATVIGRSYAKASEHPYSDNQELYGLGMSNFLSSFLGAMPSSASFSRSALNVTTGAKTRFSAIMSGLIVLLIIIAFGSYVTKIPLPALAALMFLTAFTMINYTHLLLCLKASKTDAFVVLITFLASMIFSLDVALYVGVALSIGFYLKQAAVPLLIEYTFNPAGKLRPLEEEDKRLDPRICIVHAEGELFFGAAELFQTKLKEIAEDPQVKVIILQMMNARRIDASVCLALMQLNEALNKEGKVLLASGVTKEVGDVFRKSGLLKAMGGDHFFPANERIPAEPTRHAYQYAKAIVEAE